MFPSQKFWNQEWVACPHTITSLATVASHLKWELERTAGNFFATNVSTPESTLGEIHARIKTETSSVCIGSSVHQSKRGHYHVKGSYFTKTKP